LYSGFLLRIRITALPHDRHAEGFDLRRFEPGQAYEVSARLGEFMIVMGYAQVEMRRFERDTASDGPNRRRSDMKSFLQKRKRDNPARRTPGIGPPRPTEQ
jgi:hypothetical protein